MTDEVIRRKPATRSNWNILPMPDEVEQIDFHRAFSAEEYRLLKLGYIPEAPDYHFAYFEDGVFYIHWKYTGQCIYEIHLEATEGGYQIAHVLVNRDAPSGKSSDDEGFLIGLIDDLLDWIERTEKPARRTDWKTEAMPETRIQIAADLVITRERYEKLQWGYIPRVMEDHWFYFMEDNWLHLHRSWTGYCIYQIRFEPENGGYRVAEIWANGNSEQYKGDDKYTFDWIKEFLLG